jgi:hypothetical protein
MHRRRAGCLAILLTVGLLVAACQPSRLQDREAAAGEDVPLFAPTDIRIHPFTAVKDWTGEGRPDGVEVLLELQDRFRDPVKATGSALFELYEYKRNHGDPRGDRLAAWKGSVMTLEEQRTHWNRISRTYSFQLAYPDVRVDKPYVLQVWFDTGGRRLMSQVVLDAQEARLVAPTTIPVTQPATTRTTTAPIVLPTTRR